MKEILTLLEMTSKAASLAQSDPHGWTLTLISVGVVFSALIILFVIYNLTGKFFSGELRLPSFKRKTAKAGKADDEIAAAIAMALAAEASDDSAAAVALALHLYLGEAVHDIESYKITIHRSDSAWNDKSLTMRRMPDVKRITER